MFRTKYGVGCRHIVFNQRVPDGGPVGNTPFGGDGLWHDLGANQVVQHDRLVFAERLDPGDFSPRHNRSDHTRCHRLTAFIHHKTPIGIPVERKPHIGTGLHHPCLEIHQVFWLQRVGLVIGKGAIQLEIHRINLEWEPRQPCFCAQHRGDGVAGHAIGRIHHDAKRPDLSDID